MIFILGLIVDVVVASVHGPAIVVVVWLRPFVGLVAFHSFLSTSA